MALVGGRALISSAKDVIVSRRQKARKPDGTVFGWRKSMISTTFDLDRWATARGYGEEHLTRMKEDGTLKRVIKAGKKGADKDFYDNTTGWDRETSKRVGLLAQKVGMRADWDWWGRAHPVTVLHVPDNHVVQVKKDETEGYTALQVGAGLKKLSRVTKPMMGHFARAGVPPKQILREFHVSKDAVVPVGTRLYVQHFKPGQFVDLRAKSIGKGFAGAMKRWGFKGLPASHGVSVVHRSLGATGQRQDPGKVFKGKKMHGRMGGDMKIVRNLRIIKLDTHYQMIYVIGSVPGPKKGWVEVRDAAWKPPATAPAYPTFWRKPYLRTRKFLHWRFADPWAEMRETDWELRAEEMVAALRAAQQAGGDGGDGDDSGGLSELIESEK